MSVKIGHASIDERGKINGGVAGDSTGGEVCTRSWYNGNWNVVLRPKKSTLAEKSAKACEAACANNKIGYDQYQRNTLYAQAKTVNWDISKITTACECDCSSLMHTCAIVGGAKLSYGSNGLITSNMVKAFVNSGDYEKLTDSKYLTSSVYLKRGDILVRESGHTAMVLSNGSKSGTTSTAPSKETVVTTKVEYAKSFDKKLSGTYVTTANLNLRSGAGTNKTVLTVIPCGKQVRCYGYFTPVNGTKWYYVSYDKQEGFVSSKYLK